MPGKFCTSYDFEKGLISVYEDFKAFKNNKVIGRIKIDYCYTPFIDLLYQ